MRKPQGWAPGSHRGHGARKDDSGSGRIGGFSDEFILETIQVWQPQSQLRLDKEDARQIIENAVGFFIVLAEWDAADPRTERREFKTIDDELSQERRWPR